MSQETQQREDSVAANAEATEHAASQAGSEAEGGEGKDGKGVKRRSFLKWGAGLTGVGLVVGVGVAYPHRWAWIRQAMEYMANRHFEPSAFIVIPKEGKIKLVCHRSEMGQGVRTSLPMILADELEIPLEQVEVIQGLGDTKYGSQNTDGSTSVSNFYMRLREAAAGVRLMLEQAAASLWGVYVEECMAEQGRVKHLRSDRSVTYQSLAEEVAKQTFPSSPTLKAPRQLRLIGRPRAGLDVAEICQGKVDYGADIDLPDMVIACAVRAPVPGARLKTYDDKKTRAINGVLDVVTLDDYGHAAQNNAAVCVIARHTWAALEGARTLEVAWDTSGLKLDNSEAYRKELEKALQGDTIVYRDDGNLESAEHEARRDGRLVEASYYAPFLVHAPMEPPACVAHVSKDKCEVWAPTQDPVRAKEAVAKMLGLSADKVTMHVTFLGGGFGRKSQPDFAIEAAALSKKVGKPVRIQWTREDEIKHGFYHAASAQRLVAGVGKGGMPESWRHQAAYPTMINVIMPGYEAPTIFEMDMGAINMPYRVPHVRVEAGKTTTAVRVGWFRSVCNVFQAFAVNGFVDELAERAQMDPVEYRLRLLGKPRVLRSVTGDAYPQHTGRLAKVIETVRDAFGWDKALPKGRGKGFASHYSFQSSVALALEASCDNGVIRVHRAVYGIDCGLAVNPDSVRAQMEGALAFGLSAALYGEITLQDSAVQQSNFHDYPVLRMGEMPAVEVHIINGDPRHPTGVGEPGVPVVAPALAAAIHQVTGKRMRELPLANKLV